jgi:pimeloyl-ACP methyl ester carboxylesterase
MTLPTIVFIPGAFAHPSCFDSIATLLQRSNYPTTYAPYPSLNPSDPSTASVSTDVSEVRKNFLLPLIEEQGKDVVVFAHSFGGVVAGGAAAGLCKTTRRKRNEEGGVIGLIYLVGGIVGEGERFLDVVGGAYPPFIKEGNVSYPPLPSHLFT